MTCSGWYFASGWNAFGEPHILGGQWVPGRLQLLRSRKFVAANGENMADRPEIAHDLTAADGSVAIAGGVEILLGYVQAFDLKPWPSPWLQEQRAIAAPAIIRGTDTAGFGKVDLRRLNQYGLIDEYAAHFAKVCVPGVTGPFLDNGIFPLDDAGRFAWFKFARALVAACAPRPAWINGGAWPQVDGLHYFQEEFWDNVIDKTLAGAFVNPTDGLLTRPRECPIIFAPDTYRDDIAIATAALCDGVAVVNQPADANQASEFWLRPKTKLQEWIDALPDADGPAEMPFVDCFRRTFGGGAHEVWLNARPPVTPSQRVPFGAKLELLPPLGVLIR